MKKKMLNKKEPMKNPYLKAFQHQVETGLLRKTATISSYFQKSLPITLKINHHFLLKEW